MPPDCEINWGEHRPSIKGRYVFGEMLNSSSKHHTANMKLFLLTVVCFAAALAYPSEKRKRDILPGDPRYGTDYHLNHHHHENEVEISQSVGGYAGTYVAPSTAQKSELQVPQHSYGPPNFQPGLPINTVNDDYGPPVVADVFKYTTAAPSYGVPDSTVHIPQVSNSYLEPVIQDLKRTQAPTTNYGAPVQHVKTTTVQTHALENDKAPSVQAPVTSYGTPVVADVKTSGETGHDTKVESTRTTDTFQQPEVHEQKIVATKPIMKVAEHAPVSQGLTRYTEVKHTPTLHKVQLPARSQNAFNGFASQSSSGYSSVPSFEVKSRVPSTVYTNVQQPTFNNAHSEYSSYGLPQFESVKAVDTVHQFQPAPVEIPQPLPVHIPHVPEQVHVTQHVREQVHVPQHVHIPEPVHVPQHVHVPEPIHVPQHVQYTAPVQHTVFRAQHPVHVEQQHSYSAPHHVEQHHTYSAPHHVEQHHAYAAPHHVEVQKTAPVTDYFPNVQTYQAPSYQAPSLTLFRPTAPTPVNVHPVEHESIAVENPLLKTNSYDHFKSASPVKEYVQPTDSNGGYIY